MHNVPQGGPAVYNIDHTIIFKLISMNITGMRIEQVATQCKHAHKAAIFNLIWQSDDTINVVSLHSA